MSGIPEHGVRLRIVAARLRAFRLPLREALATARGALRFREGLLLELEDESGHPGVGEALPLAGFATGTLAEARAALEQWARAWVGAPARDLDAALTELDSAPLVPAARAAAELAILDLAARASGVPLAALLGGARRQLVPLCALLPGATPEAAAAEARRARDAGFAAVKLKVGARDLGDDLTRVAAVREAAGGTTLLRLDANGAWKEADAARALLRLEPHAIELVEQPVAAGDLTGMARLRAASPIALAADESLASEAAADAILARRAADLLVLKLPVLGGPRAALRLAARARAAGVGCVVTSALDSSLGIAAALHLAAALPEPSPAAGLATASLLADDLAPPLLPEAGALPLPAAPGLGRAPDPARLARCARGPVTWIRA